MTLHLGRTLYAEFLRGFLWILAPQAIVAALLFRDGASAGAREAVVSVLATLVVFFGILPRWLLERRARRASADSALATLLDTPRGLSIELTASPAAASVVFGLVSRTWFGASWAEAALLTVFGLPLALLGGMAFGTRADETLRPLLVERLAKSPGEGLALLRDWRPIGMRTQLSTLVVAAGAASLVTAIAFAVEVRDAAARGDDVTDTQLAAVAAIHVLLMGATLLVARTLGRRVELASAEVRASIDSLVAGRPQAPMWISNDELGILALGVGHVVAGLGELVAQLRSASTRLAAAADQLVATAGSQNQMITRQSVALRETVVTAQEIKQTSLLASEKSSAVARTAENAEAVSRAGYGAVEEGLGKLEQIGAEVAEMASRIRSLDDRTRQVASITATVKELADQSNMLALNAAIEAVRSGERGRGFAVVAREMRSLADQSLQATRRVGEILDDITAAIRQTVAITESGSEKVRTSIVQVQSSGDSLRELSTIVRDHASAARQIAGAIGQQSAGVAQIFEAVRDLNGMMDGTLERLKETEAAAGLVRSVARDVSDAATRYVAEAPAPADSRRAA